MNDKVIHHAPWAEGDTVRVFGKNLDSEDGSVEEFRANGRCEECGATLSPTAGAFYLVDETNVEIGLCWMHLMASYDRIEVEKQPRDYVIIAKMNNGNQAFHYPKAALHEEVRAQAEALDAEWVMVVRGEVVGTLNLAGVSVK